MTKAKGKPFYMTLGETFLESDFDLDQDADGWTTVHELIALYQLRDYDARETHILMDGRVGMIKRNFYTAKDYVESVLKKPVYLIKAPTGKNIICVTANPDYRNAVVRNYDRIRKNVKNSVNNFLCQTRLSAPDRYVEIKRRSNSYVGLLEKKDG